MTKGEAKRLFAGQCGATLLKYLETLSPLQVRKMRDDMKSKHMKPEESRDWAAVRRKHCPENHGPVRTRTGYVYR